MKKRLLSLLTVAAMTTTMFAACGNMNPDATEPAASTDAESGDAAASTETTQPAEDTGKVLNIYCWNEEFKTRITDHYPDYKETDATHGTIGDVEVVWNITPSTDNAYQNSLDEALENQSSAADDEKVDLFLVEADYALKYVDQPVTMSLNELGISDDETSDMYQYTKDVMTDSNGVVKGVSWQGCPGILFYNREVAEEVLGTQDPDEVQEYVKDWDTFKQTADTMKEAGYYMTSSVNDTYRVYSNNVSNKWVDADKNLTIDPNIEKWVEDSKEMVDKGETGTHDLWSDDWSKGFYPEGKVFCYFGPAWLINFCMAAGEEGSIATDGNWGGCVGPQSFYWGGTWICAASGTDNANLVADIMRTMTMDKDTMVDIVKQDDDFANNVPAMEEMAASDYTSDILGGQNPLPMYMEGASKIDLSNQSAYDQGCNEEFQKAMKNYFEGNATYDEALELFYTAIQEKYPAVNIPQ